MQGTEIYKYNNMEVRFDGEMINLTEMHKAVDGKISQRPSRWLEHESATQFIEVLVKKENAPKKDIITAKRGKSGGSYGHWRLAVKYAEYLDQEFGYWVTTVVKERFEEMADPELGINRSQERAIKKWKAEGRDDAPPDTYSLSTASNKPFPAKGSPPKLWIWKSCCLGFQSRSMSR